MRFNTNKQLTLNVKVLMNRLGYHSHQDRDSNQESYIRRLGGLNYPRWHVYLGSDSQGLQFNLHLDEKQPSYGVGHRHSGQYEGDLVEREARRIIDYINGL